MLFIWSKLYINISSATIKSAQIFMYPCVISPLYLLKDKLQTYGNHKFEKLKHSQKHSHWGYKTNFNLKCLFQSNVNNSNSTISPGEQDQESVSPKVINLSSFKLTGDHISLLTKGMTFCPTPGEPDLSSTRADLDHFHRQLRIRHHFDKNNDIFHSFSQSTTTEPDPLSALITQQQDESFDHPKFREKSKWRPPPGPPNLEAMAAANEINLQSLTPRSPKIQNLTRLEKQCLAELQSRSDIIIKPADKGSSVVLQNREDYIKEGVRQLNDTKFYRKTDTDLTASHSEQITRTLQQMQDLGEISTKCFKYLTGFKPRTARFYMLPKIHKGVNPPPGRPIISGNNSPTERISQFVDHFIKDIATKGKSYVRDTTDFIRIIENQPKPLPPDTILATLDICSLYTNIPNDEGIRAVNQALNIYRTGNDQPPNSSILRLLRFVLTMNNFEFDGTNYIQTGGTAMGTKTAPNYAITTVNQFEDQHVYTYEKQPLLWLRYIDDIFVLWQHGGTELTKFIDHLNNCHQSFKFTHEISSSSVNFLDTTVCKSAQDNLYTTLYSKPTDSHMYLHYTSSHPLHCKTSLPYSQFLRIRRICTRQEDFEVNARKMVKYFLDRGYPQELITSSLAKAQNQDRSELLTPKNTDLSQPTKNDSLFAISTYHPSFDGLKTTINTHWDYLTRNMTTRSIHTQRKIFGYRRPKNLRDILVQAKMKPIRAVTRTTPKCNRAQCRYCKTLDVTGKITDPFSKRSYITRYNVTCLSQNLVYAIQCTRCSHIYVGQTKRQLKKRLYEHFRDIETANTNKSLGQHFSKANNHRGIIDVKSYVLDFSTMKPHNRFRSYRERLEKKWQYKLHSHFPRGLNTEDECRGPGGN